MQPFNIAFGRIGGRLLNGGSAPKNRPYKWIYDIIDIRFVSNCPIFKKYLVPSLHKLDQPNLTKVMKWKTYTANHYNVKLQEAQLLLR